MAQSCHNPQEDCWHIAGHNPLPLQRRRVTARHARRAPTWNRYTHNEVQFVKAALPAGEFEFDGQALHVELAEAPSAVEYFPAPQLVHRAAPVAGEYVPAPQSVHSADPVDSLYFPATHATLCTGLHQDLMIRSCRCSSSKLSSLQASWSLTDRWCMSSLLKPLLL